MKLKRLWYRDEHKCHICNLFVKFKDASRDHIVPRSHGGQDDSSNLRLAHKNCNSMRQDSNCPLCKAGVCEFQRINRPKLRLREVTA